jgi:hypothetical protein
MQREKHSQFSKLEGDQNARAKMENPMQALKHDKHTRQRNHKEQHRKRNPPGPTPTQANPAVEPRRHAQAKFC